MAARRVLASKRCISLRQGGGSDDRGKSAHMARIATSVHTDHCAEPDCNGFGVFRDGQPSRMMGQVGGARLFSSDTLPPIPSSRVRRPASPLTAPYLTLHHLTSHHLTSPHLTPPHLASPHLTAPRLTSPQSLIYHLTGTSFPEPVRRYAREAFVSPRGLVRIVQLLDVDLDSKRWVADPANRECDAPGSWYCVGRYPPKLRALFHTVGGGLKGDGGDARVDGSAAAEGGGDAGTNSAEATAYQAAFRQRLAEQEQTKPKPNGPNLPAGSFLQSCRGCSRDGTLLRCTHCRAQGPSVDSTLNLNDCRYALPSRGDGGEGESDALTRVLVDNIQVSGKCPCRGT